MKFTMIRRITALGLILVLAAGIPIQASSASTEKVTEDAASTKSLPTYPITPVGIVETKIISTSFR